MKKRSVLIGLSALFMSAAPAMAMPEITVKSLNNNDYNISIDDSLVQETLKVAQSQISPAQAKSIALSRVKGGQYVDLRRSGNTYIVRVRAPGGRVVDIKVDATTGRVK